MHWHLCRNVCCFSFLTQEPLLINNSRHTAPGRADGLPIHPLLPRFFAITYCSPQPANQTEMQHPQTALIGSLVGSLKGGERKDYCLYQTAHLRLIVQHREWYQTEFKQVYFVYSAVCCRPVSLQFCCNRLPGEVVDGISMQADDAALRNQVLWRQKYWGVECKCAAGLVGLYSGHQNLQQN